MRRLLLLALALPLLAVPPARAAGRPPVTGLWQLTFTPASVKEVGSGVYRGLDHDRCPSTCRSSYRFEDAGAGDGRKADLLVTFDPAGCPAAPCDVRTVPQSTGHGFVATLHYDGTTYSGTGEGMYDTADCESLMPKGTDSMRFTVEGPDNAPRLTGEITALFGVSFEVDGSTGKRCIKLAGYEVYTGAFTAKPVFGNPGLVGASGPGALPGTSGSGETAGRTTAARRADAIAAATHSRPVLSTRVATARDLPWRPGPVLASALLAMLLVLLMPFPAALFNSTLEANYDEVSGWFRRGKPRTERPPRGWHHAALAIGAVAVLSAFLDPDAGLDRATFVLVAGLLLSITAVSLLAAVPGRLYQARRYGERARIALYPLGLGIAAGCVLVSRLTSFEPGYLYGVVVGFVFARELSRDEAGRLTLATSGFLLLLAAVAFVARIPVHDAVVSDGGIPLELLDTVLAAVFAAGVEANVLGLLPIRFMPGEAVFGWNKVAWAAVFGVNVFAFLHALSAAAGAASTGASARAAAALFLVFGAISVTFWAYFRFRGPKPTPVSV